MYVIIDSANHVVFGPEEWDSQKFSDELYARGVLAALASEPPSHEFACADYRIAPVVAENKPPLAHVYEYYGTPTAEVDGVGNVIATYPVLSRSLNWARQVHKDKMKIAFDNALTAGFTCSCGKKMNAMEYDVQKLDNGSRLAARLGESMLLVRDYDNQRSYVALADVDKMVNELGANYQTLLQRYWDRDEAISAATTLAEIAAIVW